MSPYERSSVGAFQRSKWVTPNDVLFPLSDFTISTPGTAFDENESVCFANGNGDTYAFAEASSGSNGLIYKVSFGGTLTELQNDSGLGSVGHQGVVYYPTREYFAIIDQGGDYHTYNPSTDTLTLDVQTDSALGDQAICLHPADDVVYWTTDNQTHSDNNGTITQDIFPLPSGIKRNILIPLSNYLVYICYFSDDEKIVAYFWDRDVSKPIPDRNPEITSGRLIGAGLCEGSLIVVVAQPEPNNRQYLGKIVSYKYMGGDSFREMSHILIKNDDTVSTDTAFYADGKYLRFASPNKNDLSYESGIFRVDSNGNFIMEMTDNELEDTGRFIGIGTMPHSRGQVCGAFYNNSDLVKVGVAKTLDRDSGDNGSLGEPSRYVTEMLEKSVHRKRLVYVDVAFEKLTSDLDETVEVFYRTNPDNAWAQVGTTVSHSNNGAIDEKRLMFGGSDTSKRFPEFKQIQFKFVSKKGAVLTDLGYGFRYTSDKPVT